VKHGCVFYCNSYQYSKLFLDPSLLILHPELAQSMIEYRFNRIQGAEEKAQSYDAGYKGNRYK
jgi:trehalose/maltose hydrolase-like predicted phosphorylase